MIIRASRQPFYAYHRVAANVPTYQILEFIANFNSPVSFDCRIDQFQSTYPYTTAAIGYTENRLNAHLCVRILTVYEIRL